MKEYEIRRKDRKIEERECLDILERGEYGVLATADIGAVPYATPLSYIWRDGRVYFHCALEGRKIDNIRQNPRGGFTVVEAGRPVYDHGFSVYYASVVVLGPLREVTERDEKYKALYDLAEKYLPDFMEHADPDITRSLSRTAVYALEAESVTGKAKKPKA